MIDVEPLVAAELERLRPLPSEDRADWDDVVLRAGLAKDGRRRLGLAVAGVATATVLAVATPLGATIAGGIADFSAWLTGHPGKQASSTEQHEFDAANGLTWDSFPRGTQLRELIRTNVAGKEYVLAGFRSGTSLCLRLTGPGPRQRRQQPACIPASTLTRATAPIAPVSGNGAFFDQYSHVSAQYSFGIAADGVRSVGVHAIDGDHPALVSGNSYLWIESEPNSTNRVERLSVAGADGRTMSVPVQRYPFYTGAAPVTGVVGGPTQVEARIPHPTIGWHARHEKRGLSPAQAGLTSPGGSPYAAGEASLFKPDPSSNIVVGFTGDGWCLVMNHGSGCSDVEHFFAQGPLNWMAGTTSNGSDQSMAVGGAAADGVARIDVFFPGGGRQKVPLKSNMFAALIPNRLPIKLVAYDSRGRVVGIETFPPHGFAAHLLAPPAAKRNMRQVAEVQAPNGASATMSVGRVVNRQRCWRVEYSTGRSESGCDNTFYTGPKITVNLVQPIGRDLFVIGGVDSKVTDHVELRFDNGDVLTARPVAERYTFAIPRAHLSAERHFADVVAIDRNGHRVQRQGIAFRTP
jgi:hypothetical protein